MNRHYRLGIVIPVWKRPELIRIVLDYYRELEVEGVFLSLFIVASPEDPYYDTYTEYEDYRIKVLYVSNKPVGSKWNMAMRYVSQTSSDGIMIVGSDDLVTDKYISEGCKLLDDGYEYVSADGFYVYSINDDIVFFTPCASVGAGAFFDSDLIFNVFRGEPFPPKRDAGIDFFFRRRCEDYGVTKFGTIRVREDTEASIIDIKWAGHNINGYQTIRHAFDKKGKEIDPYEYFGKHFSFELYNQIQALNHA